MTTTNHSWASTRAAERRETRALEARLAREDADADAQRRLEAETARRDQARADRDATDQRRTERAAARAQRRAKALTWASTHVVELLIYPIALLSFALAAPAMAAYGQTIYGPLGVLLAGITELGMWAFALAVLASRHQHPTRSVVGLQAGVVVFALVAAGMNLAHGLEQGLTAGVVMAVVSIAGVLAHQLTLAGAPRSRAEHRNARLERLVAVKTHRAQRLALADATAVIGPDGTATLTYQPGTYRIARRALTPAASGPAAPAPTAPTEDEDRDGNGDGDWDAALTALTRGHLYDPWTDPDLPSRGDPWVDSYLDDDLGGGVDLLDPPAEESGRESGGESRPDLRQSTHPRSSSRVGVDPDHDLETGSTARSIDDLRGLLRTAIADGVVDPASAESIRRALRCSAARARQLRNEHRHQDGGGQR